MGHGCKIRIQQHHICNILGRIASLSHRNTAVSFFQRKNIIHTVPGHGNCMALAFKCLNHLLFLLRCYTAKYAVL